MATVISEKKAGRRVQSISHAPRPVSPSPSVIVLPHPRRSPAGLSAPATVPTTAPLPMGQRGMKATRAAKNLSARSPMLAAVVCASFGVSLLCLYVTAYARVNADRLELSRLRQETKLAQKREVALNGEISRFHLSAPGRAQTMGLMPAPPEAVEVLTLPAPATVK
ncbi:MAG: hypothetical protein H7Y38_17600 [Armatimonadetes bacterium]|nr:hypothetical protein [Armatimonadota bacterium]